MGFFENCTFPSLYHHTGYVPFSKVQFSMIAHSAYMINEVVAEVQMCDHEHHDYMLPYHANVTLAIQNTCFST